MIAALAGNSIITAGCMQQHGSLFVSRGNRTPVLHLSLIAPLRHCSPSLRHVSYTALELSVTTFVSAMMDSPLHQSLCEFRGTWMLTNTI